MWKKIHAKANFCRKPQSENIKSGLKSWEQRDFKACYLALRILNQFSFEIQVWKEVTCIRIRSFYSLVIYCHRFVEFFIDIIFLPPWRARSSRSLRVERGYRDIVIMRIKLRRWTVSVPRWKPKRAFNTNRMNAHEFERILKKGWSCKLIYGWKREEHIW